MGKDVYSVEESYVDKLDARNPLDFSLSRPSVEFLIDQNIFFLDLSYTLSQYLITWILIAVRQEVNNFGKFICGTGTWISNKPSFIWPFMKFR